MEEDQPSAAAALSHHSTGRTGNGNDDVVDYDDNGDNDDSDGDNDGNAYDDDDNDGDNNDHVAAAADNVEKKFQKKQQNK